MGISLTDLKQAATAGRVSVHLAGWETLDDGTQTYCDNPARIKGYSTYVRLETPDDPQQPFDIIKERDHSNMTDATYAARCLAYGLLHDADDFNHD